MIAPPGLLALFGSGETSPSGRRVHEYLFERLGRPIDVAILDTPAGFETNSTQVVARIAAFLEHSLKNYAPSIEIVHAPRRDRGADDAAIVAPLLRANYVFTGPGSPSYAVRHLRDTLALSHVVDRWRAGATLSAASAAAIALSRWTIPVYEIFKAGHDPAWIDGLDLLGSVGLTIAIVPHWNNTEGGADFDSRRCFMGLDRFEALVAQLPDDTPILGIDEQTAAILDLGDGSGFVLGAGAITIRRGAATHSFQHDEHFSLDRLR
ncbi:MAG: cysteinyl-tRNA synthetase [Chloroflexota bacterium]|nr:MAG: cysteinyl-tRNA synthetase [Chloroflexota bacterium]